MTDKKWDGKTKGSLFGYRFFIFLIQFFGTKIAYFFCFWVSLYYLFFVKKARIGIMHYYQTAFRFSKFNAFFEARKNFYHFGVNLIDRIAFKTKWKDKFTYSFENESVLVEMSESAKGGFLFSAHLGNWENAGNLIKQRVTGKINVVMLDAEVQKIKQFMEQEVGAAQYNLIAIKNDFSHLIEINAAIKRGELVAMHADRMFEGAKAFKLPFMNGYADFPMGPFMLVHKFKVPITFVYAVKTSSKHYALSATIPKEYYDSAEAIAIDYKSTLEDKINTYPNQWFNFYKYHVG
jgi:predicted LPLAT superfamily acyltransferase